MKIIRYSVKIFILTVFVLCSTTYSQTEQQIQQKLDQYNIQSEADIQAELAKRGMTEDDARRFAALYGIDYDQFIQQYIVNSQQQVPVPPPQTPQVNQPPQQQNPVENTPTQVQQQNQNPPPQVVNTETPEVKAPTNEQGLEYFGYKIFQTIPASFEPSNVGTIDPGYLISPNDEIKLSIWGDVEFQYPLKVDAQGNIFIPTAGQVFVLGVPYSELKNKLTAYLSQFYEGLASTPPTVFLDIQLSSLSPLRIFALGEVPKPGGYNISSFATVFNTLYSIGGPLVSGSLREIRVVRNNKVISKIDLYDYLLKGQLIGDTRLQNNDIVFIPPRQKTLSITGEVMRSAVYELKTGEGLKDLIYFAGGLKITAYTGRVQIKRIKPFDQRQQFSLEREVIDVDYSKIMSGGSDFELFDGDEVTVFPILNQLENFVQLSGAVYRPGTFEYRKGLRISDLISEAYGLLPEAFQGKIDVTRERKDKTQEFLSLDLRAALTGDPNNNIFLQPKDSLRVYSIYDLESPRNVSINGYVKTPITIPYADSLTIFDMIFRAGGLQDPIFKGRAYTVRGDLIRINPDGLTTTIIPFDLEKVLMNIGDNLALKPGDKISIYRLDVEKNVDEVVTIGGEVKIPGKYPLNKNMTPMDLILQAGGFIDGSLRSEVYVNRILPEGYPGEKLSESFTIPLPKSFDPKDYNDENKFYLKDKDIVLVRKNSEYEPQKTIKVFGEVKYPGAYILKNKNETVADLIHEAGGVTSEAFLYGAYYSRNNQRLIVNLDALINDEDEEENINLLTSDSLFIPKTPNTVLVTGEVNNPGLFKFVDGESVYDYIEKAGGLTNNADYALYSQPNGETIRVDFGLFQGDPGVYDGSIIRVTNLPPPAPTEGVDVGKLITDLFAIVASVLTIIVLATKL